MPVSTLCVMTCRPRSLRSTCVGLALAGILHVVAPASGAVAAQETPPVTPGQFDVPKAPELGKDFTEPMRTPEAVAAGLEALKRTAQAYRAAKVFSDEVALTIEMQGRPDALRFSVARDESSSRLESDGMSVVLTGGKLYFSNPRAPKRYLAFTADRSISRTLLKEFGGFNLPMPTWILEPQEAADPVLELSGALLPSPRLAGYDAEKGRVLVVGEAASQGVFTLDKSTGFVTAGRLNLSPMEESGLVITMSLTMKPSTEPLKSKIAFDATDKTQVDDLEALQPQPLEPGAVLPDVAMQGSDALAFRVDSLRGKAVVIALWADWNQVSMRPLTHLDRFAKSMKDAGKSVEVMAMCLLYEQPGIDEATIRARSGEAWRKLGLSMPLIVADSEEIAATWAVTDLPTTIVLGPDGKIVSVHRGMDPQNPAKIVDQVRDAAEKSLKVGPAK